MHIALKTCCDHEFTCTHSVKKMVSVLPNPLSPVLLSNKTNPHNLFILKLARVKPCRETHTSSKLVNPYI